MIYGKPASISGGWSDPCNHDCGHATGKLDFYQVFPIYSTINVQAAVAVVGSSVTRQARRIYVSVNHKPSGMLLFDFRWAIFPLGLVNRR